jgi:hypothetical protein
MGKDKIDIKELEQETKSLKQKPGSKDGLKDEDFMVGPEDEHSQAGPEDEGVIVWSEDKHGEDGLKDEGVKDDLKAQEQKALKRLKEIKASVSEDDASPVGTLTLRKILGGDILSTGLMRRNIWLFVIVVFFMVVYVAFRYQCQQDMIQIDRMERELKDAKYKALSSSSTLTERCRESQVLEVLRQNRDSLLHVSDQPPYIINIPKSGLFSGGE